MTSKNAERLTGLSAVFRWAQARNVGLSDPVLYRLMEQGRLERISHGLYRRTDIEVDDLDLVVIAASGPRATLCLTSALVRHDLTDEVPVRIDIALPRGVRQPAVSAPVRWHQFNATTFEIGREELDVADGLTLGLYGPERSIVDAYRLRHLHGDELGREALKRWLRQRGTQPSTLLEIAVQFPKAHTRIRDDLQVLL